MANIGPGEMTSDNLDMYDVIRTTADKLEFMLNGYSEPWRVREIKHVGGRDWVIVAMVTWDSLEEKCDAMGEDVAKWR